MTCSGECGQRQRLVQSSSFVGEQVSNVHFVIQFCFLFFFERVQVLRANFVHFLFRESSSTTSIIWGVFLVEYRFGTLILSNLFLRVILNVNFVHFGTLIWLISFLRVPIQMLVLSIFFLEEQVSNAKFVNFSSSKNLNANFVVFRMLIW